MATLTENLNLQRAALRRIEEMGNVELVDGMRVESIIKSSKEEGGWPIVNLQNKDGTVKRSIRARLLVSHPSA
jgi:ubiquinone biosynthesis monooxygenase Coq6